MGSKGNQSAVELKNHGNRFFSIRKYNDAIDCYTKAIVSIAYSHIGSNTAK